MSLTSVEGKATAPTLTVADRVVDPTPISVDSTAADPLAQVFHVDGAGAGQHHQELFAAVPHDGVALAQHGLGRLGDGLEQPVAGLVPEGVVGGLEVIDVEEQQAQRFAATDGSAEVLAEPFEPEAAVVETGQGVDGGHPLEAFVSQSVVESHCEVGEQLFHQSLLVVGDLAGAGQHHHAHRHEPQVERAGR